MKHAQYKINNQNLLALVWFMSVVFSTSFAFSQTLPANRVVDWSQAGVQGGIPQVTTVYNVLTTTPALVADGITDNFANFQALINNTTTYPSPCVFYFPAGSYVFKNMIILKAGRVIRGASHSTTLFNFKLGTINAPCFKISSSTSGTYTNVTAGSAKESTSITVADGSLFQTGGWAEIRQSNDSSVMGTTNPVDWDTSWAAESVGQLFKVTVIAGNVLTIDRPLRFSFYAPSHGTLRAKTWQAIEKVGFENFNIKRGNNLSTSGAYNFQFKYAANCWIQNIESDSTLSAHVSIEQSTNMEVRDSYFHRSYGYGGSGQGYGVVLDYHTGNVLVENNLFRRLRVAMLIQSGASGNVFGYNCSVDPVWDLAGIPHDLNLHGHFPFMNLFEGNIFQRISNSGYWGPSGPGNTFFRNRSEQCDMVNMDNSNSQNYIGNELPGTLKFDIVSGTDLIIHGNNLGGTVSYDPAYSTTLANSMYLTSKPAFFGSMSWPSIGTPCVISSGINPAKQRNLDNPILASGAITELNPLESKPFFYPNPVQNILNLQLPQDNNRLIVSDIVGKIVFDNSIPSNYKLDMSGFKTGIYFIKAENSNGILNGKVLKK